MLRGRVLLFCIMPVPTSSDCVVTRAPRSTCACGLTFQHVARSSTPIKADNDNNGVSGTELVNF